MGDDRDVIDDDLYEEIDDEELIELVQKEQKRALKHAEWERKHPNQRRRFPKWLMLLISIALMMNLVALIPKVFSLPAIHFLQTSFHLSRQTDIKQYKKAVVVVSTETGKGTGFNITEDGTIITNHHVIADSTSIAVSFPDEGLFQAKLVRDLPDVDLAILKVDGKNLPTLTRANKATFHTGEQVYFIGNPFYFHGIANKGKMLDYIQLNDWDKKVVMMDAPVYHGNSGSPVINQQGDVIGIVFATIKTDKYGKVGLFIPIDYLDH